MRATAAYAMTGYIILAGQGGNEVLTALPDWPMLIVEADGQNVPRPASLQVS